ncbi:PucR family transcriptional regulator [Streptomyces sp. NPDC001401]|uniref:PucR family transcriptional regulator n=1 Tax=Streptomyces sp. NPDC001401 TaxID=3364570 RepID=UPI0036954C5D
MAYVLTPSGRTVAATEGAPAIPAREAAALVEAGAVPVEAETVSLYERWHLHLSEADAVPPRMLHEIAAILGRCQESSARQRAAAHQSADELGALLTLPGAEPAAVGAALRTCGLPPDGPYRVIVADTGTRQDGLAEGALTEAVAHGAGPAAVGRLPDGLAFAVVPAEDAERVAEAWPLVTACEPSVPVHGGIGSGPRGLGGALAEASYALASARTTAPGASTLRDSAALTGLETLLTGIPAEVRTAYSHTVLGPLLRPRNTSSAVLLETLETFLAHDGSWARTAEALHLHVNTVHYRIGRIEHFTGRDLSSLRDRLDLWAALLCRTDDPAP